MDSETKLKSLNKWRDSVQELMNAPFQGIVHQNPVLHICVGPPESAIITQMREVTPKYDFLLYLYLGNIGNAPGYQISEGERTFTLAFDEDSDFLDRTGILIASLPQPKVQLKVFEEVQNDNLALVAALKSEIGKSMDFIRQSSLWRLIYLRNSLRNLSTLNKSCHLKLLALSDSIPAVICAAGPSLKDHLELLHRHQDKLIIIAVRRASLSLQKAGIKPDFIVDTDPIGLKYGEEISQDSETKFVTTLSVAPNIPKGYSDIVWLDGDAHKFNRFLKIHLGVKSQSLVLHKTVTVTAIDLARFLNCANIALLGSDLCLSQTGNPYAEGSNSKEIDKESLIEIAGNDGNSVISTQTFNDLKNAIEQYLDSLASKRLSETEIIICNCAEHGALLRRAPFKSFTSFCENLNAGIDKAKLLITSTQKVEDSAASLKSFHKQIESFIKNLDESHKLLRDLIREMNNSQPKMNKINQFRDSLHELDTERGKFHESPESAILAPVIQQSDDIINESNPYYFSDAQESLKPVFELEQKYFWQLKLSRDILGDLKFENQDERIEKTVFEFNAFREFSIEFVKKRNPEYADYLRKKNFEEQSISQFSIIPIGVFIPQFRYKSSNGQILEISDNIAVMELKADKEIESFVERNNYDPSKDAIIIPVPCNWLLPVQFAKKFPEAQMIVLDPWPEFFSYLISRSIFTHILSPDTLIIGVHEDLTKWRSIYKKRLKVWKKRKMRMLTLVGSSIENIDDLKDFCEEFI